MKKILIFILILQNLSIKSMEEKEKKWVFLRTLNEPNNLTPSDWHIIDSRLEFDINTDDPVELVSFNELLKEAQAKKVPFILVGFQDKDGFYKFVDGGNEGDRIWSWENLEKKWINPETNLPPYSVEFFAAGKDGDFVFLEGINNQKAIEYAFTGGRRLSSKDFYELKKNLKKSGYGHFLIAENLEYKAKKENDTTKKLALFENAYKWYSWALEYLPETDIRQRAKIKTIQDEISSEVEKLLTSSEISEIPKVFSDLLLIKNLKNLTENLRQLSTKLLSSIL